MPSGPLASRPCPLEGSGPKPSAQMRRYHIVNLPEARCTVELVARSILENRASVALRAFAS